MFDVLNPLLPKLEEASQLTEETCQTTLTCYLSLERNTEAMYFHLTTIQMMLGLFALFLIIIFASATLLDRFWTAGLPRNDFDSDHKDTYLG